ncbi:MAG: hypothetical protein K5643_04970 [Saccharofermentans sp.]|nr:hypothetical protein [Saccharofermentans sp.]
MKKVMAVILLCLIVFWSGRIYSINQDPPVSKNYNIGDTVESGDLELYFAESYLEELNEFNTRFGTEFDNGADGECRILSLCIDVTNKSDRDVSWEKVMGFIECGFESPVWASSVDIRLMPMVNIFHSESLAPGHRQKIWFVTPVNKVCFKDSSWENIDDYTYMYVLSLSPQKIAVRLDV